MVKRDYQLILPVSPFSFRKVSGTPRYLDEEEYQRKFEEQQKQILDYKQFRQQVEQWREQDKQIRNMTKERQLQECEELQVPLPHFHFQTLTFKATVAAAAGILK